MKKFVGFVLVIILAAGTAYSAHAAMKLQEQEDDMELRRYMSLFHEDFRNGYYERAIPYGWKVMELNPTRFPQLYRNLTESYRHIYLNENDPEKQTAYADTIIYILQRGIEHLPDRAAMYYLQKAHYYENYYTPPKVNEAIAAYENVMELDFETIDFSYVDRLGTLYINNREPDNDYEERAIQLYQRYLAERDPDNDTAMDRLRRVVRDPHELIRIAEERLRTDPNNPANIWGLVQAYNAAGEYDKAIPHVKNLTEINPQSETYWNELARLFDRTGQTRKVIEVKKELMGLRPNDPGIPLELAQTYRQLGDYRTARTFARQASRMDPNWGEPLIEIAAIYEQVIEKCVVETKSGWANMDLSDRVVYKLAQEYYQRAAQIDSRVATRARERASFLNTLVPQDEDYFFNRPLIKNGKIEVFGDCYQWIGESITVPDRFM